MFKKSVKTELLSNDVMNADSLGFNYVYVAGSLLAMLLFKVIS